MVIHDLYSKRQKALRGEVPDVYQYEIIPSDLRVQVVHIIADALGTLMGGDRGASGVMAFIHRALCREYSKFRLGPEHKNDFDCVMSFFLSSEDHEQAIDVIELTFQVVDSYVEGNACEFTDRRLTPDEAIDELNQRFREHGVGYQFEAGKILRVDSQFVHSEVVKPVLTLLAAPMYEGTNAEFLNAHAHYRAGRLKECLNDCHKAFESCMKAICDARGWEFDPRSTASGLLDVIFDRGLVSPFLRSHFTGLRTTLEAGVPTVRNRLGGHGQGVERVEVPDAIASYALHLTATNILLLAQMAKDV